MCFEYQISCLLLSWRFCAGELSCWWYFAMWDSVRLDWRVEGSENPKKKNDQEPSRCCSILRHGCDWDMDSLHHKLFFNSDVITHIHDRRWDVKCWWGLDWQGPGRGSPSAPELAVLSHFPNLYSNPRPQGLGIYTLAPLLFLFLNTKSAGCKRPFLSLRPVLGRDFFPLLFSSLPRQSSAYMFSNVRCYTSVKNSIVLLNNLQVLPLPCHIASFPHVRCIFFCIFPALNSLTLQKKRKIHYQGKLFFCY